MQFGDHVGWAILTAWIAPAALYSLAGPLAATAGEPGAVQGGAGRFAESMLTILLPGAPVVMPAAFVVIYTALWIGSRELGWPGYVRRTGMQPRWGDRRRTLAFWLYVAGLPCLLAMPLAFTADSWSLVADVTDAPFGGPEIQALFEGLYRSSIVGLPLAAGSVTVTALAVCLSHLAERRGTVRKHRPGGRRIDSVAPSLAIGYLLVLAGVLVVVVPQRGLDGGAVLQLLVLPVLAGPLLFPLVWPVVLVVVWRSAQRASGRAPDASCTA